MENKNTSWTSINPNNKDKLNYFYFKHLYSIFKNDDKSFFKGEIENTKQNTVWFLNKKNDKVKTINLNSDGSIESTKFNY